MSKQQGPNRSRGAAVTRRRFVQGLGLAAAGFATGSAVACANKSTTTAATPAPTAKAGAQPTAQPVRGGTLAVAMAADITPSIVINGVNPNSFFVMMGVYERLTHYRTDKLEAEPELAESWKFSADYTSLTVKLRPNVKFHTGKAFTSADVKWNIERGADPKIAFQAMNMCQWVQKMELPDALTIVFYFDRPRPAFTDVFEILMMGDAETYQDSLDGKRFVGTGPFLFKEWMPGDHYTLVRNPGYWQSNKPYLDKIVVKVIPEAQTRLINLQTGNCDVAVNLEPRDTKVLEADKNYSLVLNPVMNAYFYFGVDLKVPPFGDKRVRQALAYLIDRKRIIDTQLFYGEPLVLPWDKGSPAYVADLANRYEYNPTKAKELLAQAGIGSDVSVKLFPSPSYTEAPPMTEVYQAEMAKLGWKTSIEKLAAADSVNRLRTGTFGGIWCSSCGFIHMTPGSAFILAQPMRIPNGSNFDTPAFRTLIDDITQTADPAALTRVYRQMDELWLDECFVLPVASNQRPHVSSAKVRDLALNRGGMPVLLNVWKSK